MLEPIASFAWLDEAGNLQENMRVTDLLSGTTEETPGSWEWYTPDPSQQLSAPQNFVCSPGNGKLTWTWDPPLYNGGSSVTSYILRLTPHGSTTTTAYTITDPTAGTYSVTGLTNGTAYDSTLDAVNALGEGPTAAASGTPSAVATKPGPPTNVSATVGDKTITINWDLPSSDGGSAITGGTIQRGTQTAISFDASTFSQVFNSLTNGTEYTFVLHYINAIGTSDGVTIKATPTAATSLAAGHVPGTVMLGFAAPQSTPRPGFAEARKIVCWNSGGTLVRDVWLKRNFVKNKITTSTINGMMSDGDPYGLYNVITFKYLTQVTKGTQIWNQVTNGSKDADLQVLADFAKSRRTTFPSGANKFFAAGIHHEPAGDGPLADWAAMQIYCSQFFKGFRRTAGTSGPYVYHADQDVSDIMAWICIANGNWWSPVDQTSINAALPDNLISTFKTNRHIVAADFYEPTGAGLTNASGYADVGWVPARPANGKCELRIGNFITDMKGRPGGCGALGIGEYNSVSQDGMNNAYNVMKANKDVFMFANYFNSASGSKWEYRLIPNSYPQISKIALPEYPPGIEVGGTWMSEQKLNVFKKNLDDTLGKDSTDTTRMTQWTGWP